MREIDKTIRKTTDFLTCVYIVAYLQTLRSMFLVHCDVDAYTQCKINH